MPQTKEGKDRSKKPVTDQDRTEKTSDDHGGRKSKDGEKVEWNEDNKMKGEGREGTAKY